MQNTEAPPRFKSATRSRVTVGLDIGSHSAKVVVACRRGQVWNVIHAGNLRLGPSIIVNPDDAIRHLRDWLKEFDGSKGKAFSGTLPSTQVDYETVEMTANATAHDQYANECMQQLLGSELKQVAYDYWMSEETDVPRYLNLAWSRADYASRLTSGLARLGWECRELDAPAHALARIAPASSNNARTLVVDVGAGEISLVSTRQGNAEYIRNRIRFSPLSATDIISNECNLHPVAAETLLANWGMEDSRSSGHQNPADSSIFSFTSQLLANWFGPLTFEIGRTLQYLQHRHGPKAVERIVLCGGGANIRGLPNRLQDTLALPVQWACLPSSWQWVSAEPYSPLYSQALCLAQNGL
jgi:Tfp pilus assembly PilM family ATPase